MSLRLQGNSPRPLFAGEHFVEKFLKIYFCHNESYKKVKRCNFLKINHTILSLTSSYFPPYFEYIAELHLPTIQRVKNQTPFQSFGSTLYELILQIHSKQSILH